VVPIAQDRGFANGLGFEIRFDWVSALATPENRFTL
jgi:hypothetical protein